MCLWKDRFSIWELVRSRSNLAEQLKLYKKAAPKYLNLSDDYVQWLKNHSTSQQLNRVADLLLELCQSHITLSSLVSSILWEIEVRGLLPDRRLQMEFFSQPPFSLRGFIEDLARRFLERISSSLKGMQTDGYWRVAKRCLGHRMSGQEIENSG